MIEQKFIPATIGWQTCVGYLSKEMPLPATGGNSFSFSSGYKCVNSGAENIEEATKRFLPDGLIECLIVDNKYAVIIDERIPKEWLTNYPRHRSHEDKDCDTWCEVYHIMGWKWESKPQ